MELCSCVFVYFEIRGVVDLLMCRVVYLWNCEFMKLCSCVVVYLSSFGVV